MKIGEIKEKYTIDAAIVSRRICNDAKGARIEMIKNTESELVGGLKELQGLVKSCEFAKENASYARYTDLKSAVEAAYLSLKATIDLYRKAIAFAKKGARFT